MSLSRLRHSRCSAAFDFFASSLWASSFSLLHVSSVNFLWVQCSFWSLHSLHLVVPGCAQQSAFSFLDHAVFSIAWYWFDQFLQGGKARLDAVRHMCASGHDRGYCSHHQIATWPMSCHHPFEICAWGFLWLPPRAGIAALLCHHGTHHHCYTNYCCLHWYSTCPCITSAAMIRSHCSKETPLDDLFGAALAA